MPARSPEQIGPLFQQAIGQGDLDAAMALYEPGAVFPSQSGEPPIEAGPGHGEACRNAA